MPKNNLQKPSFALKSLYLLNFKNYEETSFRFGTGIQSLTGRNGIGKTNLLDAIHYLCMTRSAFHTNEHYNILQGKQHFILRGEFEYNGNTLALGCQYEKGKRKIFKLDKVEYERMSEHIGKFPCVMLIPDDSALIREGSEVRRKFFDNLICQTDSNYLQNLLRYNQALKQRNYLLKKFGDRTLREDKELLEPYTHILLSLSKSIAQKREQYAAALLPIFETLYQKISGKREKMEIRYSTKVDEGFEQFFRAAYPQDLALQRTTQGIHQDRYTFHMGGQPLKRFGSQGQQKSFLIALKLAKAQLIMQQTNISPVLLLDDIFDKLDETRISNLLEVLGSENRSQIFLTDARPERSEMLLKEVGVQHQIFSLGDESQRTV